MRHEGPRSLICSGRRTSATVALVVCTVATATALVARRWSAIVILIAVAAALGSYWWMVTAEARQPALKLRAVVFAIAFVLGVAVTMAPQRSGDVWSYAMYGRIVAVHHASPYRHVPDYTDLTVVETAELAAFTQTAMRAPPGSLSGGRSVIGE